MNDEEARKLTSEGILSDEQLKAVGCLALESARLEEYLERAILDHCGDVIGGLLVRNRMIDAKTEIFKEVFTPEVLDEQHAKELKQLYDDIKSDIPKRNTVVHGYWEEDSLANRYYRLHTKGTDSWEPYARKKAMEVKASEVMELARRFGRYQERVVEWYMPVQDKYVALHGK